MRTKEYLARRIAQIKTKQDFFNAPASVACWYAYHFYKIGKYDREQFDKVLKEWWRHNHPPTDDELRIKATVENIQAIFG